MPKILMPYTVHLDHTLRVTPVSTLFYKGDSNAHRFELNVLSKGLQADLSGCTAVYRFYRLQDSTVVSNPASIESGKVVAVLDKACYDYIGRFALTIAIQNGEDETTVFYGDGYMSGNRADTGITGDYVVYDVETLLAKIAEIETAIANANTAIANANTAAENANVAEENANAATQASQTQQEAVAEVEAKRAIAEKARQDAEKERQETFAGFEGEIGSIKDDVATLYDQTDALFALCLDGTPATYKAVMKSFFLTNGAASATPAELTALCDRWYTATRTGWDGGVKFYAPDVSAVSDGEKNGDNAGLTCVPSTNTVAGQDDYAGLPLFACVDVNWIVDPDTLEPVITAIDGITGSFDRYDPAKFVGVMQMSGYRWWNDDDTNYYLRGYCDTLKPYANIEPLSEAVRASDNSVRPWVVHAKYMAKVESGKFTCYSGVIPTAYSVSHNSSHTYAKAVGSQYSGGTAADNAWLKLMSMIKYGSLTQDGVNQGCVQYNFQYPAAVAESGVQRVIIPKDQAANLIVGSSVIIGSYAGSLDRGNSGMYSITGQAGAVITSIQEVTIDGNTYAAVNVDCAAFDTVANGASTTGTTYISTWHWRSGTCDNVLGNDGSPDSPGSGKYPAMIQGIEYSVGGYEVYADVILNLYKDSNDVYWYEPYLVNRSAQQSTGITSNYKATGLKCQQPDASNWLYIKKEGYAKGIYFPVLVGGSSSTYHRDGFYMNAASAGTREWLAFGNLSNGVGNGGLSYLGGGDGLSLAWWGVLARLSPNGNRGEWAA